MPFSAVYPVQARLYVVFLTHMQYIRVTKVFRGFIPFGQW